MGELKFIVPSRHEHLYEKISRNVITSNKMRDDALDTAAILTGSRVILCTLSMLSNPLISEIARQVPVETVVVDEASQIEVGEYIPMLYTFQRTLRKLVFIGDDKQR
jgi:superfamily I DNA and/or RNA helicase